MDSRFQIGWALIRATFGLAMAWFHGHGKVFGGKVEGLTQSVAGMGFPFPAFFAWAASLTELVGGLFFAIGLATRPAAAALACTMLVALYRHRVDPFAKSELALLFLCVALAGVLIGGGRWSVDAQSPLRRWRLFR